MGKFINDIHDFVNFLTGKDQTGYHSPEEIDLAVYNASKTLFNEEYAKYSVTQQVTDDMAPFMVGPTALFLDGTGSAPKPWDYRYVTSLRSGTSQIDVDIIDEAFWGNRSNDPVCPPLSTYPICIFYKDRIQFLPTTLSNVKITFFKDPGKPIWAYNIVSNRFVYDDTNSVDIEWNPLKHKRITMLAMSYLGINLREDQLEGYVEMQKKQE